MKKLDMDPSKAWITDTFEQFLIIHTFCECVRIASTRRFYQIHKTYVFLKNNMGITMKKYTIRWFLCRPNWRYNTFRCYNESRYKEGSLYMCLEFLLRKVYNVTFTLLSTAYKLRFWWTFQHDIVCLYRWLISSCNCCVSSIVLWYFGQIVWCKRFYKLYKSFLFSFIIRG